MVVGSTTKILLGLVLLYCCAAVTEGRPNSHLLCDCCKAVSDTPIAKKRVKDYSHQVAGECCQIDATIFVTRKGAKLCAPRSRPWVHELMKYVDDVKEKCRENNYQGKLCQSLKPK